MDEWSSLEIKLGVEEKKPQCPVCGGNPIPHGSPQVIVTGHRLRGFAPVALGQWCRCTKCNSRGIFDI